MGIYLSPYHDEYACGDCEDRQEHAEPRKAQIEQRYQPAQDEPDRQQDHADIFGQSDRHLETLLIGWIESYPLLRPGFAAPRLASAQKIAAFKTAAMPAINAKEVFESPILTPVTWPEMEFTKKIDGNVSTADNQPANSEWAGS